ncbi:MAG: hypothetical protein CBARDCOR_2161 [uncultured Caballeronia sp.]|nr:MAG: hypothetical protein CBARDCOR_2161 [uncultured Caballeronia sp.]
MSQSVMSTDASKCGPAISSGPGRRAAELYAAIWRLHDSREILEVIEHGLAFNDLIPAH